MKTRPLSFYLVTFFLLGLITWMPLQIAFLYGHTWSEFFQVMQKISLINGLTILGLGALALSAWNGSRWLYATIPGSLFIVAYNNHLVGVWGYDYSLVQAHWATAGYLIFCGFLFLPPYSMALQNPRLRWWLVATRVPLQRPAQVAPFRGRSYFSYTVDLSATGALLEFSHGIPSDLGDTLDIALKLDPIQILNIKAQVVRELQSTNQVGVHFASLDPQQRNMLQRYLQIH